MKHLLIVLLVPALFYSCLVSEDPELEARAEAEAERLIEEKMQELYHTDSLQHYSNLADSAIQLKNFSKGIEYLNYALNFGQDADKNPVIATRGATYFEIRKYNEAIEDYSALLQDDFDKMQIFYLRALCYHKLSKLQEAASDLQQAIALGNTEADELHEKINPIKKRVAYYETRCCDGTTSNAKGRGACSHHGGVCNWNEPVYEEYRKY